MGKKKPEISHFLNQREFAKAYWNEDFHPLDVNISYRGQHIQVRSKIREFLRFYQSDVKKLTRDNPKANRYILSGYFTEEIFREIMGERVFPLFDLLMDEIILISKVINFYEPFDIHNFTVRNFSREYSRHTTEIIHILDDSIKDMYLSEMKGIFAKTIDPAKSKEVFKISNYYIHYINWDNTFRNFYEMTYEVMPKAIRMAENYLSEQLRTTIKAYMAFVTQVNIIRRQFEKVHPGKISSLAYFEWEDSIRAFLLEKFEKIFGGTKATQYVDSLHHVIFSHLRDSSLIKG